MEWLLNVVDIVKGIVREAQIIRISASALVLHGISASEIVLYVKIINESNNKNAKSLWNKPIVSLYFLFLL